MPKPNDPSLIQSSALYFIIFLEGFVTISFEILTIRQLLPMVGNNVIVTSLIIGIFLLCLAYGYRKGGSYEGKYKQLLLNNFTLAAVGLGIGLSYPFIVWFFALLAKGIGDSTLVPLLIYLLLITAPVVYLLGQTVPITLNLYHREQRVSAIGGRVLHLSTLGSFFGAVLTTLILLNYFGVAWTIFFNFIILIFLILLLLDLKKNILRCFLLISCGIVIFALNVKASNSIFIATNNYANYAIINDDTTNEQYKVLQINNSTSSFINKNNQAHPYIEYIKKILFHDLNFRGKDILVLGAGGFTFSAQNSYDNNITFVDIDNRIEKIVKQHFLATINGKFIADDARHYLRTSTSKFDAVLMDTYSNKFTIPTHLLTYEYFQQVKNILKPGGIAFINIIGQPELNDVYSKRVDNTIRAVFPNCTAVPLDYYHQQTNIIYVCKVSSTGSDKMVYTDDLNRSSWDSF